VTWLLLPASILEKFVGTVVLIAALLVTFPVLEWLIDLVAQGLGWILLGRSHPGFNPASPGFLQAVATAFLVVPVFLFGSVFFRKGALLKTLLAMFAAVVVLSLFLLGLILLMFGDFSSSFTGIHFGQGTMTWGSHSFRFDSPALQSAGHVLSLVFNVLFWFVFRVFFLVTSFLRLTEIEVRDGVS
jgi:hypothetical protein